MKAFCYKKKNKVITYTFTILFQVILLFAFLIIFYFNYVNKVERDSFIKQIQSAVDVLTGNLETKLPKGDYTSIIAIINNEIKNIKASSNHTQIDTKNKQLENTSFEIMLSIIAGFSVFVSIVTFGHYCLPLLSTATEGILSLCFVALTEFIFLQIVAKQYISADPNKISFTIFNTLFNDSTKFINSVKK